MSVQTSEFRVVLTRRLQMLTGGRADSRAAEVKVALVGIERTARQYQRSMLRPPKQSVLWRDLAGLSPFSNAISSQYERLLAMARAWATPGQRLHRSATLLRDVKWGLEWLNANEFNAQTRENGNWYDFEIDAPGCLTDTLILLGDEVTPNQLRKYLGPVLKFDSDPEEINPAPHLSQRATGANRTDKALVDLFAGALLKHEKSVAMAVAALKSVFPTVTEGDGFYEDGSFVFHRFFPYTGNYGEVLLADVAESFQILKGTRWDLGARRRVTAGRWAFDAFLPLIWRGGMMDMVRGRLISFRSSPSHVVGHRAIAVLLRLSLTASAKDAAALRAQIKRCWAEDTSVSYTQGLPLDLIREARRLRASRSPQAAPPLRMSKVFASMDRAVHLRPTFGVGLSMHSTRIQNYESINGDDLHGWHTSDGMLYLYDADLLQFDDSFWPTVDPERLPGTTAIANSHPPEGQFGGSSAVGGTSLDGYSAVMMQLNVFQGRLQAKQSWFLFDDEVVALGADIRSIVDGSHIETIVENRRLTSTRTPPLERDPRGRWANLPASASAPPIGYVFLEGTKVKTRRAMRTGSWRDIDTGLSPEKLSATYQTIWIDHGVKPTRASYGYVLLPGMDAVATAAYAARPAMRVLENSAKVQAVEHASLGITAVNFWAPGESAAGISANSLCSVIVRRAAGRILIAVSDPTQTRTRPIRVTIRMAAGRTLKTDSRVSVLSRGPSSVTLAFRAKDAAGKPLRAEFVDSTGSMKDGEGDD